MLQRLREIVAFGGGDGRELREARRMLAAPVAARPEWVREIATAAAANDRAGLRALRFGWMSAVQDMAIDRGVGVVQISGPLIHGSWLRDYSDIRSAIDELAANAAVHAILLEIDSPGGDVHAELFQLAARIREVRAEKPVYALADGQATSAAYVIASQASRVYAANANTTIVGSLGVIAVHVDWSGYNERQGLEFVEIVTGRHKNELSPDRPLSREGRSTLERLVEGAFVELIASVTAGRGGLTDESIRAQQAAIYLAGEGVEAGLVDDIATRSQLIDMLARGQSLASLVEQHIASAITAPGCSRREDRMSLNNATPETGDPVETPASSPPVATPDTEAPKDAASDATAASNVVDLDAERARVRGESRAEAREIVALCGLAGRPSMAVDLLAEPGMTVPEARKRLLAARVAGGGDEIVTTVDASASEIARLAAENNPLMRVVDRMVAASVGKN